MGWSELSQAGLAAYESGKYLEAQQLLSKALEESDNSNSEQLATSLFNLGRVHLHVQEYGKAEPLLTKALSLRGKALGLEHSEVASVIDELGTAYLNQDKFAEAEPLLQRGLEMRKKTLGSDHPDVAQSLVSLGALRLRQRRYPEAKALLSEALQIQESKLGPDHQDLASSLGLLSILHLQQKELLEAGRFATRAVSVREKNLGSDHPDVAMSLHILAMTFVADGKSDLALDTYKHVLTIRELFLPRSHALNTATLRAMATILFRMRKLDEAQVAFEQLVEAADAGGQLDDMLAGLRFLGWCHVKKRSFAQGAEAIETALIRINGLGKDASRTRENLKLSLFCCYAGQHNYGSAAKLLPSVARVMSKDRSADLCLVKQGLKAGLYAGKR